MSDPMRQRAYENVRDSVFDFNPAETEHMVAASMSFARSELLRELYAMRQMDMGEAADRMLELIDELEAGDED